LGKVRHLDLLHESQQQPKQTTRADNTKTTSSSNISASVRHPPQKPKVSPPVTNRAAPSTVKNKTAKVPPRSIPPKPKAPQTTTVKSEKPRPASIPKKVTNFVNILLINILVFHE